MHPYQEKLFLQCHVEKFIYSCPNAVIYVGKSHPEIAVKAGAYWVDGKAYAPVRDTSKAERDLKRECSIYQAVGKHPHITTFRGFEAREDGTPRALYLDYYVRGSLRRHIEATATSPPSIHSRIRTAIDLADVIQHLHSCNVVWGDLSTRNTLVDSDGGIRLCDFSSATLADVYPEPGDSGYEIRYWPALPDEEMPELGSVRLELSALGSAVYEITEWAKPYSETPELQVSAKLGRCERPLVGNGNPARDVISSCWDFKYTSAGEVASALRDVLGLDMQHPAPVARKLESE